MFPFVHELSPAPDVVFALSCFADLDGALLLDSAACECARGRYSFLTAEPFRWFKCDDVEFGDEPLAAIRQAMQSFSTEHDPALPPFQGGAAGMLGYELGRAWERLPERRRDVFRDPALAVGIYDWVLAWDHEMQRAWIVAQGFPAIEESARLTHASQRVEWARARLASSFIRGEVQHDPLGNQEHCSQLSASGTSDITSSFTRDGYCRAVQRVIDYVKAGDVFQANISQRLIIPQESGAQELYRRLRLANPAPFAAYFATDDWAILSSSPERFVSANGNEIETRPIKGTRRRSNDAVEDAVLRAELASSEKDRAENVMIVDLLRNDFSRVCEPTSIRVPELCSLESYETVHHLVSSVVGRLEADKEIWDLFAATFPGGSVTGAPKIRAMEIIAELEPNTRGPYCGSLFYVGFDGTCDSSILIRTMIVEAGHVRFNVGGGVTARSDPEAEYLETLHKASGLLRALGRDFDSDCIADDLADRQLRQLRS